MTTEQIKAVLVAHLAWLRNEPGGVRASLIGASLDRASLDGASLIGASLNGASLDGASLDRASLVGASLDFCSTWNAVKWSGAERVAMSRLKTLIPPEEYARYERYAVFAVEGAFFGRHEWVGLPTGWYCVAVNSPEPLPSTDRLIHRLLLWRNGREAFLKCAQQQR